MESARPRKIRVYSNRRLYDPIASRYIKYDDLYALLREGIALSIKHSDTGTDCTHRVLVDLVIRQELDLADRAQPALTDGFLRELIRSSDAANPSLVAKFLDHTVQGLLEAEGENHAGTGSLSASPPRKKMKRAQAL